jgi:hypothetical protein
MSNVSHYVHLQGHRFHARSLVVQRYLQIASLDQELKRVVWYHQTAAIPGIIITESKPCAKRHAMNVHSTNTKKTKCTPLK